MLLHFEGGCWVGRFCGEVSLPAVFSFSRRRLFFVLWVVRFDVVDFISSRVVLVGYTVVVTKVVGLAYLSRFIVSCWLAGVVVVGGNVHPTDTLCPSTI